MSTRLVRIMSDSYWLKPTSRPTRSGMASYRVKTNHKGQKNQKGRWGILHGYSWRCVCCQISRLKYRLPVLEIHHTICWFHAEEIRLLHKAQHPILHRYSDSSQCMVFQQLTVLLWFTSFWNPFSWFDRSSEGAGQTQNRIYKKNRTTERTYREIDN